ncbi:MAG TPA: ABC transporter permease [Bdellovibrionales bacterium]|nr:ABC transporter permease [Bdellovibrionales bacterium]
MIEAVATSFGTAIITLTRSIGEAGLLFYQVIRDMFRRPFYFGLLSEQIYHVGIKSLGIVFVTAFSIGMVMALQFGLGLEKFGGKLYVPKIVSLSIVREMAPVFCSLMLAARVGAGIASELGSMLVTQQIDAIRALGTSPIKRVVIPRILACVIAIPLLCALGNIIGITGAAVVGISELGLDPKYFLEKVLTTVVITDFVAGIVKTYFFSLFISVTACYFGLNVKGGTQGVGSAVRGAVVTASIMILAGDFFLTKAFFIFFEAS